MRACVYDLAGQSPSFSQYDVDNQEGGDNGPPTDSVRRGVRERFGMQGPKEPTLSRDSRVSAQFDSAPAAAFFQGTANFRW